MRRIYRTLRILLGLAIAGAVCVVLAFTTLSNTPFGASVQALTGHAVSTEAANAALDSSGIKESVDTALRENVDAIAEATGLSDSQVRAMINKLNVEAWSVQDLPSDSSVASNVDVSYEGIAATVTTYDDPSYVTVDVAGQSLTLTVPESAQEYMGYVALLDNQSI